MKFSTTQSLNRLSSSAFSAALRLVGSISGTIVNSCRDICLAEKVKAHANGAQQVTTLLRVVGVF